MNDDLNEFLEGWAFDPELPSARRITTADGRVMVQLRVDMGLLQMEPEGRPDGARPHGAESALAYYQQLERDGKMPETLSREICAELLREAMQFCARAQAYQALEDWPRLYDDCEHVLDLIDLISDLAENDEDAWHADQLYPGVRLSHAIAAATIARDAARLSRARTIVEQAIADIARFYREVREDVGGDDPSIGSPADAYDAAPPPPEIQSLQLMLDELEEERPKTREENLRKALERALAKEDYERAAAIRDQLNALRAPPSPRTSTSPGQGKARKPSPPTDTGGSP
ncbi:MAG: UvrB/UvrC motif-containing protein [Kiritimatiellae bacterium]|nr:UvrB/UvrC motif-containing protein [Kiritimatiellia bacterium]